MPWEPASIRDLIEVAGDKSDQRLWSPSLYKPKTTRGNDNIIESYAFVLDADCAPVGTYDAVRSYYQRLGLAAVMYSSWSHLDPLKLDRRTGKVGTYDCFRVWLPFSRPVTTAEFKAIARVAPHEPAEYWDPAMKKPSQGWYGLYIREPGAWRFDVIQGRPLDVEALLAESPAQAFERKPFAPATAAGKNAWERFTAALGPLVRDRKSTGEYSRAVCPACQDPSPSLTWIADAGAVRPTCHAGCSAASIVEALDLTLDDLGIDRFDEAKYELSVAVRPEVSRDEAQALIRAELDSGTERLVIALSTGAGKTHTLRQWLADNMLYEQFLWAFPSHAQGWETFGRLEADGVFPTYKRGIAAQIPGRPECAKIETVRQAQTLGMTARWICQRCEHAKGCRARVDREVGDNQGLLMAPHALLRKHAKDRVTIVDEEPEWGAKRPAILPPDTELVRATGALRALADGSAQNREKTISTVLEGEERGVVVQGDTVEGVLADAPSRELLKAIRDYVTSLEDEREGDKPGKRTIILSATASKEKWEAKGYKHMTINVKDNVSCTRLWVYRAESSRRWVCPGRTPNWELIARAWDRCVVPWLKCSSYSGGGLLIGTYRPVVESEEFTARLALPAGAEVVYYGAVRGVDKWKDFTHFVSMFDPFPGGSTTFTEKQQVAADELEQFHGRARGPSREAPAHHLHIGTVRPGRWHADNTQIERSVRGRKSKVSDEQIFEALKNGGQVTDAAKALNMNKNALYSRVERVRNIYAAGNTHLKIKSEAPEAEYFHWHDSFRVPVAKTKKSPP